MADLNSLNMRLAKNPVGPTCPVTRGICGLESLNTGLADEI